MADNLITWLFRADGSSMTKTLRQIADDSDRTHKKVQEDAKKTATVYEHLGRTTVAFRETVSGLAGMVGLGGLAFGLKDAIEGGIKLQGTQGQLQQALRATGQASKDTYETLNKQAENLSTHGGFATDENLQALTAFTRETHDAYKAQGMLSLATNIARGRNMDLASAQSIVARAYTGQVGRLQQLLGPMVANKDAAYGLTQAHKEQIAALEQEAKAMGKSGAQWLRNQEIADGITPKMQALAQLTDKRATAQEVMSAAERVFAGATGTYAGTTQGKISDLQNQLKNLADTTGEKLLPAVSMLARDATVAVGVFSKLPTPVQASVIGLTALGVIAGPLKNSLGLAKGAIDLFTGAAEKDAAATSEAAAATARAGGETAIGGAEGMLTGTLVRSPMANLLRGGLALGGGAIASDTLRSLTGLGNHHGKHSGLGSLIGTLAGGGLGAFFGPLGIGVGAGLGNMVGGLFSNGGVVKPRYLASGGPVGTDTVPAWLTPYEGVVNTRGMSMLGERGLSMLNAGAMPSAPHAPVNLTISLRLPNSRELTRTVVNDVLNAAARGPSSLVGGSLVTGAPGFSPSVA